MSEKMFSLVVDGKVSECLAFMNRNLASSSAGVRAKVCELIGFQSTGKSRTEVVTVYSLAQLRRVIAQIAAEKITHSPSRTTLQQSQKSNECDFWQN